MRGLVLCGGVGKRLRPKTFFKPKPMKNCMHCNSKLADYRSKRCKSCNGKKTGFTKGHKPWNKDKRNPKLSGKNHPAWKGDNASYRAVHRWVKLQKFNNKLKSCEWCDSKENLNIANISREYKRDLNDYMCLCAKCHWKYDKPWINRERNRKGQFI